MPKNFVNKSGNAIATTAEPIAVQPFKKSNNELLTY